MQPFPQRLVQPQGLRLVGMHQHQRAIALLVQRVEREHLLGRFGCGAEGVGRQRQGHDPRQRAFAQLAQALAFHQLPFLERMVRDSEVIEEGAAIERGCLDQRVHGVRAHQALQLDGVDLDPGPVERDGLAIGPDDLFARGPKRPAQAHQRLLQAVARLAAAMLAPQHAGQAVARLRAAGRHGEKGQQGAVLDAAQLRGRVAGQSQLEPAKKRQLQARHLREGCMSPLSSRVPGERE